MYYKILTIIIQQALAPDHFDWVAIAGILGTLFGTGLGSFVTWKIQHAQLAHEDRTRFHDRRLTTYSDFTYSCNAIFSAYTINKPISENDTNQFLRSTELLRLIASDYVFNKAIILHSHITLIMNKKVTQPEVLMRDFNNGMAALALAIRKEIGVKETEQKST